MKTYQRIMIILLLSVYISLSSLAQDRSVFDPLNMESCKVQAPVGYLDKFWDTCVSPWGYEPVSVLHLGDSHVQGGFFSEPIRSFFDNYFGLAGLGWVAPYSLLRTNQPYPSKVVSKRGNWSGHFITSRKYNDSCSPTGIVLTAVGKGIHEIVLSASNYSPIVRAVVFRDASTPSLYLKGDTPGRSSVKTAIEYPITDTLELKVPMNSLTLLAPEGARWYGVSLESSNNGVLLHTIGYNGAFFSSFEKNTFCQQLPLLKPKLILVSLGTNDMLVNHFSESDFANNVRSFIKALQSAMPDVPIILTSPLPAFKTKRLRKGVYVWGQTSPVAKVANILEREAESLQCGYINVYSVFSGIQKADGLVNSGLLSKDRVHLTKEGYQIHGDIVANALLQDFRRYLEHNNPIVTQKGKMIRL